MSRRASDGGRVGSFLGQQVGAENSTEPQRSARGAAVHIGGRAPEDMLRALSQFRGVARLRRPTPAVFDASAVEAPGRWDVDDIRSAIESHEEADFESSGRLVDAFGRDDRISACLNTRVAGVLARNGDFSLDPADDRDKRFVEAVESWWWEVIPDDRLAQILRDIVAMGLSLHRIHWNRSASEWRPVRLERWHPSNVEWDDVAERFRARLQGGTEIIEPDDPNWLLIHPATDMPWMCGGVRALGLPFVMRQFNWRDWARFNERHGQPVITIHEPAGAFSKSQKGSFYGAVKAMGSTGILRLPKTGDAERDFQVELLEAKAQSHETFGKFQHELSTAVAVFLLGQNLTTDAGGGSYALGTVQNLIRLDYRRADVELLSTQLRAQLILRWGRLNFRSWVDDLGPWPTWDTSDPVDRKEESEGLSAAAMAAQTLLDAGFNVDWDEFARRTSIPIVQGQSPMVERSDDAPEPDPEPDPDDDPDDSDGSEGRGARARMPRAQAAGYVEGQLYTDDLSDGGVSKSSDALGEYIDELEGLVANAEDYESLRLAVLAAFRDREPPDRLAEIVQKTLILAEMAGESSASQDA